MALKTVDQIKDYLKSKSIPFDRVKELPGGSGNFIFRVEYTGKPDVIIKHAEPYVKNAPAMPFTQERMDYEVKMIRLLNSTAIAKTTSADGSYKTITPPTIYHYDQEMHVIQLSCAGPRTLKEAYEDSSLDISVWGDLIGAWVANLHRSTRPTIIGQNEAAKIYRHAYRRLESRMGEWGFDGALGARINDKYGAMLDTDDEVVCHGDCWPGNFIMSEDLQTATVVDWEMTRRGCGATDVGQFAAEAYLLDFFRGGRGLAVSFLKSYKANSDLSRAFAERVAVHFGTHLSYWPTAVEWGSKEQTMKVVQLGVEVLTRAEAQDWPWFESSVLQDVFNGAK